MQWSRWLEDLPQLQKIDVDRCFKPKNFGAVKSVQLHIFSDGSRVGYGAVAFLPFVNACGRIHCSFVMGKARLAPIREITIPRLELTAAVISVKLSQIIREELETKIDQVNYWTDSMTVLKCINNDTKRFHVFESNRLTIIRSTLYPSEWRYVSRDDNPADDASKSLKLEELTKNGRWLNGPAFLWKEEANRPIANMATISPKRGFSVATVARGWLPVFTCAVAGKTAASQASFPLNSTKISQFSSLKKVSIWYTRFGYCFSMLN